MPRTYAACTTLGVCANVYTPTMTAYISWGHVVDSVAQLFTHPPTPLPSSTGTPPNTLASTGGLFQIHQLKFPHPVLRSQSNGFHLSHQHLSNLKSPTNTGAWHISTSHDSKTRNIYMCHRYAHSPPALT